MLTRVEEKKKSDSKLSSISQQFARLPSSRVSKQGLLNLNIDTSWRDPDSDDDATTPLLPELDGDPLVLEENAMINDLNDFSKLPPAPKLERQFNKISRPDTSSITTQRLKEWEKIRQELSLQPERKSCLADDEKETEGPHCHRRFSPR